MTLIIPENLAAHAAKWGRRGWIASLPAVVAQLRERWDLERIDEPFQPGGQGAWVAPARSRTDGDVVLKIAARHEEGFDEAKGLREWDGEAAVRLLADEDIDETTSALLLERCRPGNALKDSGEEQQDEVIAGLLRRLWKTPPLGESFRALAEMCDGWAAGCAQRLAEPPEKADPGLIREGIALFRALPRDASSTVLLCTDLHAENVLAAEREPWLMIDPKPYVGDPTYDVLQHLINCEERLHRDPSSLVRRLSGLLDLDAERLTRWLFARCVVGAVDQPDLLPVARRLDPR